MASLTWWTWVWLNSRCWWWTGRPGVLRFMGSQRIGHDWVTELNWLNHILYQTTKSSLTSNGLLVFNHCFTFTSLVKKHCHKTLIFTPPSFCHPSLYYLLRLTTPCYFSICYIVFYCCVLFLSTLTATALFPKNSAFNWGFSSVQFNRSVVSNSLWPHEPQQSRPPCPSPTPRVYPNSWPLSRWCHPTISSSVVPFSSCPQSFRTSG